MHNLIKFGVLTILLAAASFAENTCLETDDLVELDRKGYTYGFQDVSWVSLLMRARVSRDKRPCLAIGRLSTVRLIQDRVRELDKTAVFPSSVKLYDTCTLTSQPNLTQHLR